MGRKGEGRVDPINVKPYSKQWQRHGLGSHGKRKPVKKKKLPQDNTDIFNTVNNLLGTDESLSSLPVYKGTRQQKRQIKAKLQTELDKTEKECMDSTEAYRQNKQSQFATKLKNATSKLQDLKKLMNQL